MAFNRQVLLTFFISRLYIIGCALAGTTLVPKAPLGGAWDIQVPFFNLFARWDSAYYIIIAKSGYSIIEAWAYRPLFPFLLNLVAAPFSPPVYIDVAIVVTGFFLNNTLFLIALFLVHNLTTNLFSKEMANDTIILLAFYPTAISYSAIYAEAPYLLLTAISFLFVEERRFFASGVFGFLAGLSRPEGIFASIVIFLKSFLTTNEIDKKIKGFISAFVAGASILAFAVFAWIASGDFGIIFSIYSKWDKVTLLRAFNHPNWIMGTDFISFFTISLPMIAVAVATIFLFFIREPKEILRGETCPYYVHAAFLVIFFLAIGDIRSLARYFSTIIPIYWTLSLWLEKKSYLKTLIMLLFLCQLALVTILFVNWYQFI